MIVAMLCANAQIRLPTRKRTFASTMISFLPQISLILPHKGIQAAFARRYDEAIHEKPLSEAPNCEAIVGRAVEMMVYKISVTKIRSKGVKWNVPYPKLPRTRPTIMRHHKINFRTSILLSPLTTPNRRADQRLTHTQSRHHDYDLLLAHFRRLRRHTI